jgi:hypothetical protein
MCCYMQVFTKEIKGAKYTVYYEFDKNYLYPVTYHVRIIKSTYKKLKDFKYINLLSNLDLKSVIENELYMPVV